MNPFPYHGANENLKPHLEHIIAGYEYGTHDVKLNHQPTVLDIGANVGAYSYWVMRDIPGAFIFAYEPEPKNAVAYSKNLIEAGIPSTQWRLFQGAVSCSRDDTINLYLSQVNAGMHSREKSLTNTELAQVITVPNYHPNRLPSCDIMKLDTEGCELEILQAYLPSHPLPVIISVEFHSRHDYYEIDRMLSNHYIPNTGHISGPDLGTINYVRNTHCK